MLLVTQTDRLASLYGDRTAVQMLHEAGFDGIDYSMFFLTNGNHPLLEENWRKVGIENVVPALPACGSSDIGNVSHVCPAIHPYYSIQAPGEEIPTHTEEFREATLREPARKALQQNVCAMAMTGKDIMDNPHLLQAIKDEFKKSMEHA